MSDDKGQQKPRVVLCCPTLKGPYPQFVAAVTAEVPHMDAAGLDHGFGWEPGCPYISQARATLLRRALDDGADIVVFLDHDLSWTSGDLTKLILTEGDVVSGLYRFKMADVEFMGTVATDDDRYPIVRESDGALKGMRIPGGFLKVTKNAVRRIMRAHPELLYGDPISPHVDLFQHGAHEGVWWGEDYAFSRRWRALGGDIWIVPDLDLVHHDHDAGDFPGNLHRFLLKPDPLKEAA